MRRAGRALVVVEKCDTAMTFANDLKERPVRIGDLDYESAAIAMGHKSATASSRGAWHGPMQEPAAEDQTVSNSK